MVRTRRIFASLPLMALTIGGLVAADAGSSVPLSIERVGKAGAPMVLVPAGPFTMGVPPGDRDGGRDEYPRHEVYLDRFATDKFEVTYLRYVEFIKGTFHRA